MYGTFSVLWSLVTRWTVWALQIPFRCCIPMFAENCAVRQLLAHWAHCRFPPIDALWKCTDTHWPISSWTDKSNAVFPMLAYTVTCTMSTWFFGELFSIYSVWQERNTAFSESHMSNFVKKSYAETIFVRTAVRSQPTTLMGRTRVTVPPSLWHTQWGQMRWFGSVHSFEYHSTVVTFRILSY